MARSGRFSSAFLTKSKSPRSTASWNVDVRALDVFAPTTSASELLPLVCNLSLPGLLARPAAAIEASEGIRTRRLAEGGIDCALSTLRVKQSIVAANVATRTASVGWLQSLTFHPPPVFQWGTKATCSMKRAPDLAAKRTCAPRLQPFINTAEGSSRPVVWALGSKHRIVSV